MLVRQLMHRHVTTVRDDDTLSTASQIMLWMSRRHLPVVKDGQLTGILSERDILRYRAAHPEGRQVFLVRDAMTADPKIARPEEPVEAVRSRMLADRIGCMPVVDGATIVGIVTTTDILRSWIDPTKKAEAGPKLAVDVMTRRVTTAAPSDSLAVAAEKMMQAHVRHLPVVDGDGRLIGVISDRDLRLSPEVLRSGDSAAAQRFLEDTQVKRVMTPDPIRLGALATLDELAAAFGGWHLSAIPVTAPDDRLIGMVSYVDVVAALAKRVA